MLALSSGKKNKCYMDQFTDALQKSKAVSRMVDSFVNKDIVAQDSLQLDELEKGKAGQLGEIRTWGGKKYQKTPKGWRPVKTGAQSSPSSSSEETKKQDAEYDRGKILEEVLRNAPANFPNPITIDGERYFYRKSSHGKGLTVMNSFGKAFKAGGPIHKKVLNKLVDDMIDDKKRAVKLKSDLKELTAKVKEQQGAGSSKKDPDGWKEGFGGGVIWKEYSDSDFKVVEIKKDDKNKYHLNIGGYKAPNAITESEAIEKKISEIRSQSYDSLEEAKMMADVVSRMKYSDIVKESKTPKDENHLSATKTRISKYEEKISAEIKKLQEKLETAKKQAETTAKVEAAIPDVFKRAGLGLKSATLILNEDNPESQSFNIEANIPGKFMVKEARGSNSAADKAYENALAKSAILSSMVESFFKEKGLTVKASINPYSLQYEDSSEKNNSTARIDLKISNYGK